MANNLLSLTVKSVGDQQIANKTHVFNKRFIKRATEANNDTTILYLFRQGIQSYVVDETSLSIDYDGAFADSIGITVKAVDGISVPASSEQILLSEIVIAYENVSDNNDTDIIFTDGRIITIDETVAELVS